MNMQVNETYLDSSIPLGRIRQVQKSITLPSLEYANIKIRTRQDRDALKSNVTNLGTFCVVEHLVFTVAFPGICAKGRNHPFAKPQQ